MSTVKAGKGLFWETSALCRDIAEPLMRNHSIVPGAKRWCCYCKEEEKKVDPDLFSGVWGQLGGRGRAKGSPCFFQVMRCSRAILMYRTPQVLVGRAQESDKTRYKNMHLEGGEGREGRRKSQAFTF